MVFNMIIPFISSVIFLVYVAVCIISIIFTLSLETYQKIDEKINSVVIPSRFLTFLDTDIDWVDTWLMEHNKIAGTFFILFSLLDLKLFFDVINKINTMF